MCALINCSEEPSRRQPTRRSVGTARPPRAGRGVFPRGPRQPIGRVSAIKVARARGGAYFISFRSGTELAGRNGDSVFVQDPTRPGGKAFSVAWLGPGEQWREPSTGWRKEGRCDPLRIATPSTCRSTFAQRAGLRRIPREELCLPWQRQHNVVRSGLHELVRIDLCEHVAPRDGRQLLVGRSQRVSRARAGRPQLLPQPKP